MQSLVDTLAEQRKRHLERVERLHIQDIKEMVSYWLLMLRIQRKVNYVPRKKTHEELMKEVKVKKTWTGSGNANDLFDK